MPKIIQFHDIDNEEHYPKIKNDFMVVNLNQRQYNTNTSNTKINFNTVLDSNGDGLTLYNGGIRIGKGIPKIRVDLSLWIEAYNGYSSWMLYKNDDTMLTNNIFPGYTTEVWRTGNAFAYVSVKEGDIIYTYVRFSVANSNNNIAGNYSKSCLMGVHVIE